MSKYRTLPDAHVLAQMAKDKTHAQIAAELSAKSGETITRSAVSSALSRAGLSEKKERYSNTVPWNVAGEHDDDWHLRMLRALGRRQAGRELDERTSAKLDHWLAEREKTGTRVTYSRKSGFSLEAREGSELIRS